MSWSNALLLLQLQLAQRTIEFELNTRRTEFCCHTTHRNSLWNELTMVIQGVIRPPPEIRAVADRTALYVAKNGRAFEQRILGSEKGKTPKFAFLHTTSPFHAYYEQRIQFYESGGEDEKEEKEDQSEKKKEDDIKKKSSEGTEKKEKTLKASAIDPVAKALLTERSKFKKIREEYEKAAESADTEGEEKKQAAVPIPPPPTLHFVNIVPPASLTIAQIETIQLVAQLTALDGKNGPFLSQLTLREWNNPAFAFCQPRHGHFAYFSALVDAYRHVLGLWTAGSAANDNVKNMANNVDYCLNLAAYRAEYERDTEEQARKRSEAGVPGAAQIDWHDFVVVETIDFPADEKVVTLPPPPSAITPLAAQKQEDMEESEEEDEQIRVVPSYTPKVARKQTSEQMVIDPITGKSVPVKDLPEHMRIQLLDPKWAEERKKFQEKQKDSNLVSGDMVASNIARFAQARGDTFGKKVREESRRKRRQYILDHIPNAFVLSSQEQDLLDKETDSKKRLEEANRIIREQAGPTLPMATSSPKGLSTQHAAPQLDEPAAKRTKMEITTVPPPPPPPATTQAVEPPPGFESTVPEDPFAAAAMASASVSEPTSELIPEADFAASLSKPEVTLQIRIPNDPSQMAWNFYGQIVSISADVMSTVKSVKQEVSKTHLNGMPSNKIQFKSSTTGAFLKDSMTLAALNIGPTATLELIPKTRGGRK